jgi:hypothetical protein
MRAGQKLEDVDEHIINDYIGSSFLAMKEFGPQVYRPFMQVGHATSMHAWRLLIMQG